MAHGPLVFCFPVSMMSRCSKLFFAHLSRRLTGELIGQVGLRRMSSTPFKLSSETTGPVKVKFHIELLWDWGIKVCSTGTGHMTEMAAMPIYGKNLKKNLLRYQKRPMTLKLGMQHRVLENYQVCSNDDPGLSLTYFMARSNLVPYAYV